MGKTTSKLFSDEFSCFTDGVFDELLRPYVLTMNEPKVAGFFGWSSQFKGNLAYSWLLHMAAQYCFPIFTFRRGVRHEDVPLMLEASRLLTPLIHGGYHLGYQLIELFEENDRLSYPDELQDLFASSLLLSR